MLPPGHIAAGYLVAKAVMTIAQPDLTHDQIKILLLAGGFFGFAPDLDMFYVFWKERGLKQTGAGVSHRAFFSHTPIVWLVVALLVALLGHTLFWYFTALLIWLGSWSHFMLDSTVMGIRWLYPFSKKFYALKNPGLEKQNLAVGFFRHWGNLLVMYYKDVPVTVCAEIALVLIALVMWTR